MSGTVTLITSVDKAFITFEFVPLILLTSCGCVFLEGWLGGGF